MRKFFMTAFALSATLVLASSSFALEKTARALTDDSRADAWNAGGSCTIQYYNFCTGWLWVWSGWAPGNEVGVSNVSCCGGGASTLTASWHYILSAGPSGYGFTGTIEASAADANNCPTGAPIQSQVFLPVSGWNNYLWSASVPANFVIHATFGPATGNPTALATDHPAAGPTGPQACGTCYPTTRVNHSFDYGTAGACPGSTFNDGICDSQLYWDCDVVCSGVAVEPQTWGNIKNLYR